MGLHETLNHRDSKRLPNPMNFLPNDTKIRFCNAVNKLSDHTVDCNQCNVYVRWADGDMCDKGKEILATELAYADTTVTITDGSPRRAVAQ